MSASVSASVFVSLCSTAASLAAYPRPRRRDGRSNFTSNSSIRSGAFAYAAEPAAVSVRSPPPVPFVSMPSSGAGRSTGKDHWSGTAHTFASGKRLANGPTNTLCSYGVAPRRMWATPLLSSALSCARNSSVGATGLYTSRWLSRMRNTVQRTLAEMPDSRISCSNE